MITSEDKIKTLFSFHLLGFINASFFGFIVAAAEARGEDNIDLVSYDHFSFYIPA